MGFLILFEALLLLIRFSLLTARANRSNCPSRCGDVEVTYPFGISDGCSLPGFELECIEERLIISRDYDISILEISQTQVQANSSSLLATYCPSVVSVIANVLTVDFDEDSPFTFSRTNRVIAVGCDAKVDVSGSESEKFSSCFLRCNSEIPLSATFNGSCTGTSCCEVAIPPANNRIEFAILPNEPVSLEMIPCSYGFIAEDWIFDYPISISPTKLLTANMSMRLDWAVGKSRCDRAAQAEGYACGGNTTCVDASRGYGYLCKCLDGFSGNPYLSGSQGCQDIDECTDSSGSVCAPEATCYNKIPGYVCQCPRGSSGDGLRGHGCSKRRIVILASIASVAVVATTAACVVWCCWTRKKRSQRSMYFQQNGGLLLNKHLNGTPANQTRLFTASELTKATSGYDKKRIIGSGGHGTVYRGILNDGTVVAVKKSNDVDRHQIEHFINELVVLARVDHKNIVKLLGCCLETQVPLLVYEFVPNGTLQQKLEEWADSSNGIHWCDRIRIAYEIADAISYLHNQSPMPIFHRDVKTSNILLDENETVKLADFGISRLVAADKDRVSTAVRGTIGYLDPEYFRSGKLTDKSDVYSYGVVLLELLTCLKPSRHELVEHYSCLVIHFLSYAEEGNILGLFDSSVLDKFKLDDLQTLADIAKSCLTMNGNERPTMKKVTDDLARLFERSIVRTTA